MVTYIIHTKKPQGHPLRLRHWKTVPIYFTTIVFLILVYMWKVDNQQLPGNLFLLWPMLHCKDMFLLFQWCNQQDRND